LKENWGRGKKGKHPGKRKEQSPLKPKEEGGGFAAAGGKEGK